MLALAPTPTPDPTPITSTAPLVVAQALLDAQPTTQSSDKKQDEESNANEKSIGDAKLSTPKLSHEIRNPLTGLVGNLEFTKAIVEKALPKSPTEKTSDNKDIDSKALSTEVINGLTELNTELGSLIKEIHASIREATKILDAAKAKALQVSEKKYIETSTTIDIVVKSTEPETSETKVVTECNTLCSQASVLWNKLKRYSNILKNQGEDVEEFLDGIDSSIEHLTSLVYPFLSQEDQAKREIKTEPKSLTTIIKATCSIYTAEAKKKGLRIVFEPATKWDQVFAKDTLALRQILINLITNAIHFTSQGSITIELAQVSETKDLQVTVIDTGMGMSPERVARLLGGDPYHQGDNSPRRTGGKGTGLGIHLSRDFIGRLGGTLHITSTPDVGSTFTFTIAANQLIEKTQQQEKHSPRPSSPIQIDEKKSALYPQLRGKKALIAEDNEINQRVLRRQLGEVGIDCEFVNDGQKAVDKWREYKSSEKPDIILMDTNMPVKDGLEATQEIREGERDTHTRVLIVGLSGNGTVQDREAAIAAGMNGYLTKPIIVTDLYRAINELLLAKTLASTSNMSSTTTAMSPLQLPRSVRQVDAKANLAAAAKPINKRQAALFDTWCCFYARSNTLASQAQERVVTPPVVTDASNTPSQLVLGS